MHLAMRQANRHVTLNKTPRRVVLAVSEDLLKAALLKVMVDKTRKEIQTKWLT